MSWFSRFTGLFRRRSIDAEFEDEFRSHLEMRVEQNLAEGMSPQQARLEAVRRFGNRTLLKEEARRFDLMLPLESIAQDVRYALRTFRKAPVFPAVALLTLTLAIGGNTAIFTLTYAMLLRSLPVQRPGELVRITFSKPDQDFGLSGPMYDEIVKRQQVYTGVFGWADFPRVDLNDNGELRPVPISFASGNALQVLGVRPALGRAFTPEDDKPGGGPDGWAGMLTYQYWTSRLDRDPGVVGRTLTLNNVPVTIVGVLPRGFEGADVGVRPALVVPLECEIALRGQSAYRHHPTTLYLNAFGRLKPGYTLAQAREEIRRIGPAILHDTDPQGRMSHGFFGGSRWGAEPGRTGRMYLRSEYREPLLFLQLLVGLILLIGCANVSGLMLARSSARRHEFALRAALGASRMRIVRQLAIETGLLAFAGAAGGLVLARFADTTLLTTLVGYNNITLDLNPDLAVLLFTTAIATLAALLASLPAALRSTSLHPIEDLKSVRVTGRLRTRFESVLVTTQLGLSLVLVVAAAFLASSLYRLLTLDPGFQTSGVVLIPVDFSKAAPTPEARTNVITQVLQRIGTLPNVVAGSGEEIPMLSKWTSSTQLTSRLPDGSVRNDDAVYYNRVGPNYFATAGTAILAGRDVQFSDRANSPRVCWINQAAAAFLFPQGNPVGQILNPDHKPNEQCGIAGVVENTKYSSLREAPRRIVYWPLLQTQYETYFHLMVRAQSIAATTKSVRRAVRETAPAAVMRDAITMREQLHESIGREQVTAMLALFFGGLALLLAAIGIYGLLAYQVVQRTHEIGVRIALGATPRDIVAQWIARAGRLTVAGLALGIPGSLLVARLLGGLLFGVTARDPAIYVGAAAVLTATAAVATYLPAARATHIDPAVTLREE